MCIDQETPKSSVQSTGNAASTGANASSLRIEPVDNWHSNWSTVLQAIHAQGQSDALLVDRDGWLSARQVLLVAFSDQAVAGHICFRISPAANSQGDVCVEAHLDTFGVTPGFEKLEIGPTLKLAARQRAESLKCGKLVGF